jgi:hypothetical protein
MKTHRSLPLAAAAIFLLPVFSLLAAGCNYDVPLTAAPTRPVDPRLLGNWVAMDGKNKIIMRVRKYDEQTMVLSYEHDVFRAYHSDVAGVPLVSVENLDRTAPSWLYINYRFEDGGRKLTLRSVHDDVVHRADAKTPALAQQLVQQNFTHPGLYGKADDEAVFQKE